MSIYFARRHSLSCANGILSAMDPFSITAGIVGVLDCVTKLSCTISRFKADYKLADADLEIARQHALLLQEEIGALESGKLSTYSQPYDKINGYHQIDRAAESGHPGLEEASFAKAMSTAHKLLSSIDSSFSLRSEPHTWRSKVRWAMKDKHTLAQLKEKFGLPKARCKGS